MAVNVPGFADGLVQSGGLGAVHLEEPAVDFGSSQTLRLGKLKTGIRNGQHKIELRGKMSKCLEQNKQIEQNTIVNKNNLKSTYCKIIVHFGPVQELDIVV